MHFFADEVIWTLVFFGLEPFPLLFLDCFHVQRELWTPLLLVWGFLGASTLTFAFTLLGFLGSLFSFQRHCLVLSEYRPGQSQAKTTMNLTSQTSSPKSYAPLGILCEVSSSLGPWEYFGICKDWVLEKEISRQSDVPIILVLGGTPTLHIVDEHVISFTPTNTKFQKNALSHI